MGIENNNPDGFPEFAFSDTGDFNVSVEVVDPTKNKVVNNYILPRTVYYSGGKPIYKSARYVANKRIAEISEIAAAKITGVNYQVVTRNGIFSTNPDHSFELSPNEVGVYLKIKDKLSEIIFEREVRRLKNKFIKI